LRAPRIGRLAGNLAGQGEADVILGQQQHPGAGHHLRLVPVQPHQFRRGDPGIGRAIRPPPDVGHPCQQLGAFGQRALVVPQDRRAQWAQIAVQQHLKTAAHLPIRRRVPAHPHPLAGDGPADGPP
jgi:hypothetical protein